MAVAKYWNGTDWVVIGFTGSYQKITEVKAAPWVTINQNMPIFVLDPDKFTIDNKFTSWPRVLLQPAQTIDYIKMGEDKLKVDEITFKFDATTSAEIRPVSVPLYSNRNNPTVTIT